MYMYMYNEMAGALCRKKFLALHALTRERERESALQKCRTSEGFLLVCPFTESPWGQIRCEIFKPSNIPGCIVPVSDPQIARRHQSSAERRSIQAMNGSRLHKHGSHSHSLYMYMYVEPGSPRTPYLPCNHQYFTSPAHREGPIPASFTVLGRTDQSFEHPVLIL